MQNIFDKPEQILDIMRTVADEEILPRFQKLEAADISEKKPGDLVTIADKESEAALRRYLGDILPGSVVIGEEGFETDPKSLQLIADAAPVWIVDPVDGTHNFAHGKQPFTVIVALVKDGKTVAGWIIDPLAGDAVWAMAGAGSWQQSASGAVSQIARKNKSMTASTMTAGSKLQNRITRAASELSSDMPQLVARYRCVGREYMDIAQGSLDMARYGGVLKPWDHAAGCLIVREAGGQADNIAIGTPYQATPTLSAQSLGVVGDTAHWPAFLRLIKRADELADQHG
jgi:fructose-1,6-bisphosphatase/inositol monophosphatase family enzyme